MKFTSVKIKKVFTISFLIKILLVGIVVSCGYAAYSIFYAEGYYFESKDLTPPAGDSLYPSIEIEQKDYPAFFQQLAGREIFAFPRQQEAAAPEADKDKARRLIDNLKLVGIKFGEAPRAIIESRQQGKTFYLKAGDTFLEDIKIEAIGKDLVILNCYGESFELYL